MQELQARQMMVRLGESLYRRNYTVGSSGNLSVKLADGFLITPTDACLGMLTTDSIAKIDPQGHWLDGPKPSKTLALHRSIYAANPETFGVVHTHSTNLVSLTLGKVWSTADILPPITPYQLMKVGHVPLIAYDVPGSEAVAARIAEHAAKSSSHRAVMLERLGPVVWGKDLQTAVFALEELEETAKLFAMNPQVTPLTHTQISELNKRYSCNW